MSRSKNVLARSRSPVLGRLEVVRDDEGVKLFAHGALYAVQPSTPAATPAPWIALACAPWMIERRPGRPNLRVAFLGYGGGTVARLVRGAGPEFDLVGVEPDAWVRELASRSLDASAPAVRLEPTDAATFLRRPTRLFDALLDDIYAPREGRLARPVDAVSIPGLACRRLRRDGVYAVNLISPGGRVEREMIDVVAATFANVVTIFTDEYAHKVVVASASPIGRGALSRALRTVIPGESLKSFGLGPVRRVAGSP